MKNGGEERKSEEGGAPLYYNTMSKYTSVLLFPGGEHKLVVS